MIISFIKLLMEKKGNTYYNELNIYERMIIYGKDTYDDASSRNGWR